MDVLNEILGKQPGKVIAVHLSYASRAAQRGRTPAHASYFFKASSSLCGSGDVVRPQGTELLGFEGEIAVIIGKDARNVTPDEGWSHVGWVTASNDLGLHDLRTADKGSNVRSKSGDGYSPIGPRLIEAAQLDPAAIGVRTWLDGELVQDDSSAGMIFEIGAMIADLSRFMTLEAGDVILTGTPAGASVAQPGQRIEVEVFSLTDPTITSGKLVTTVVEGPELAPFGNPPFVDDKQRSDAWGHDVATESTDAEPAFELTAEIRERLMNVAVATLSSQLRKRGFNEVSIDGVSPLIPGKKLVGRARTLRYLPYRKDQFAAKGGGYNAQKRAIDSVNEGEVLVMDARRVNDAGTLGDILALRAQVRGAAGIITDGCVRDYALVAELGMPVFAATHHPAVLGRRHIPWETDVDIACGGALVQVGDVIVADDDGPIVIPPHLVLEVLEDSEQQENEETFIAEMVAAGESVDGLYPLNAQWRERYDAWRRDD
ncbi:MAG TPA: fumarylacetoacetate hydrolase family protein [Tessaracoccus flavescens]|uniref:Fumarylacetoacetate hydrolase family protein n=1 Tax=Tessaracoccus flavescens TaxID=399497 RepID=A0A921EM27_9ACTN|nr:fumarylacetoacetate hydrolase family protein [Tessaracoccus flavescens]